jgi:hypothetical protein
MVPPFLMLLQLRNALRFAHAGSRAGAGHHASYCASYRNTDVGHPRPPRVEREAVQRMEDAAATVRRGVEIDPRSPSLYRPAAPRVSMQRHCKAREAAPSRVEWFPEDFFPRSLAEKLRARRKNPIYDCVQAAAFA